MNKTSVFASVCFCAAMSLPANAIPCPTADELTEAISHPMHEDSLYISTWQFIVKNKLWVGDWERGATANKIISADDDGITTSCFYDVTLPSIARHVKQSVRRYQSTDGK